MLSHLVSQNFAELEFHSVRISQGQNFTESEFHRGRILQRQNFTGAEFHRDDQLNHFDDPEACSGPD